MRFRNVRDCAFDELKNDWFTCQVTNEERDVRGWHIVVVSLLISYSSCLGLSLVDLHSITCRHRSFFLWSLLSESLHITIHSLLVSLSFPSAFSPEGVYVYRLKNRCVHRQDFWLCTYRNTIPVSTRFDIADSEDVSLTQIPWSNVNSPTNVIFNVRFRFLSSQSDFGECLLSSLPFFIPVLDLFFIVVLK